MNSYDWPLEFRKVYDAATRRYTSGERHPIKLFSKQELEFLASIGCTAQELFDFIDDFAGYGEPDYKTTLLTTAVRRDYFMVEINSVPSSRQISMKDLPPKTDE